MGIISLSDSGFNDYWIGGKMLEDKLRLDSPTLYDRLGSRVTWFMAGFFIGAVLGASIIGGIITQGGYNVIG